MPVPGPTCAARSPSGADVPASLPGPYLRRMDASDRAFYCALYGCADAMRHIGPTLSVAEAQGAFQRALHQGSIEPVQAHYWMIMDPLLESAVGLAGIVHDRETRASAELGVLLAAGMANRRYASGAVTAICGWAFTAGGLSRLWTRHAGDHVAARRLMDSVQFRRCAGSMPGEWRWQRSALAEPTPLPVGTCFHFARVSGKPSD